MVEHKINVGEKTVQKLYRISIQGVCKAHGIAEGDLVEVWIKKARTVSG